MIARRKLRIVLVVVLGLLIALGIDAFRFLSRHLEGPAGVRDLVSIVVSQLQEPGDIKETIRIRFPGLFGAIRNKVKEYDREFPEAGKNLDLPEFELILSRNDVAHFDDLYTKYNNPIYDVAYYSVANQWRKGRLTFEGRTYKVKVKSHGRHPDGHQEGRYISFAIKLKRGEQIRNSRRFSLIVRGKLPPDRYTILSESERLGLLTQVNDMVRLKINNWDEKIYLFTPRLDDKFMEARKKPSLRRHEFSASPIKPANKSLVINATDATPIEYETMLKASLAEALIAEVETSETLERYRALNETIVAGDYAGIGEFFDREYIATVDALQTIFGFPGHGWVDSNLHVFFDTANGMFYPVVTRDNLHRSLNLAADRAPEKQVHKYYKQSSQKLWSVLSRNDEIRQLKYNKIYEYARSYSGGLKEQHEETFSSLHNLHYYGRSIETMIGLGLFQDNYIQDNLDTLVEYLERSEPMVSLWGEGDRIAIGIDPKSMSALKMEKFVLTGLAGSAPTSGRVQIALSTGGGVGERSRTVSDAPYIQTDGRIDLSGAVEGMLFSDFLDEDLQITPRRFVLTVQIAGMDSSAVTWSNVDLAFKNMVTGMGVDAVSRLDAEAAGPAPDTLSFPLPSVHRTANEVAFAELRSRFPDIAMRRSNSGDIVLQSGTHRIMQDFIVPRGSKLHVEAGTRLLLGEGVALIGYNGVDIKGTKEEPVEITAVDPAKPFGSVGFLGDTHTISTISYLELSRGSERWFKGAFFSGGLSIHYNGEVRIAHSNIHHNRADDGLNVKFAKKVIIEDCIFANNFADQVDLDVANGQVSRTQFLNTEENDGNGDGLDVSGSKMVITNSSFHGFDDKGLSVGEDSTVWVQGTKFDNNLNGVAVKDLSRFFLIESEFENNTTDLTAYQKKDHFGGGTMYVGERGGVERIGASGGLSYKLDAKSMLFIFPSDTVAALPDIAENNQAMDEAMADILQHLDGSGTVSAPHPEGVIQ